jgi:phosphatidylglycerol:prolipoprotein diacylglycerol transferase
VRPELFRVFDVSAPAYFILLLTGFLFATAVGALWARRIGHDPDVIVDLGLACLLAGVVGGRLLHVLADGYFWDYVHLCTDPAAVDWKIEKARSAPRGYNRVWDAAKGVCHPAPKEMADKVSLCFSWAKFWAGGLTYYGGFIGASACGRFLLLRHDKFPVWKACDMAGIVVPLGLGFGRMGCLLAGCCFGVETRRRRSFGLSFPRRQPRQRGAVQVRTSSARLRDLVAPRAPDADLREPRCRSPHAGDLHGDPRRPPTTPCCSTVTSTSSPR